MNVENLIASGATDPWLHYAHSSIAILGDLDNRIRLLGARADWASLGCSVLI